MSKLLQPSSVMKLHLLLGCSILLLVNAFTLLSVNAFTHLHSSSRKQTPLGRRNWPVVEAIHSSSSTALASSCLSSEIFLLSFDGTVARTTEWRITQGIELAFSVWPQLREMCVVVDDDEWLRNKMRAISSVLVARPGCSMSVDYALLARLLIEEQQLDQGRSNGSSGKYGSKFHPQNTSSSSSSPQPERRGRGSRPLTVGEIKENWTKGGCLADTVLTKYHIDYKNPLPILQERIDELNEDGDNPLEICCHDALVDAFEQSTQVQNLIVTVGHESDLTAAAATIDSIGVKTKVLSDDDSLAASLDSNDNSIKLLPISTTHGATYEDVLKCAPSGSTVYIFESSWSALEQGICLFGDRIPRGGTGMAQTILGRDIHLSLNFPQWSTTPLAKTHETQTTKSQGDVAQQNEAMMNPWTNLVAERDFSELLSARIVPSSM